MRISKTWRILWTVCRCRSSSHVSQVACKSHVASQKVVLWIGLKGRFTIQLSQYNFLRRDKRLATHATSCDSDTRFTIFFMFATSSCTSSNMHVHCTWTQGRNSTPGYSICVFRVSHVAKVELSSTSATGALRQLATAHDWQFLVATVANRVSRRRKLYCESALMNRPSLAKRVVHEWSACSSLGWVHVMVLRIKRDSQKLFCDATRDATAAKPGNPQIATIADPTQLPQQGRRRPSQKLSLD